MKQILLLVWLAAVVNVAGDSPFPGLRGEKLDLAACEDIWDKPPGKDFLSEFVRVPRAKFNASGSTTESVTAPQQAPASVNVRRRVANKTTGRDVPPARPPCSETARRVAPTSTARQFLALLVA